MARKLIAEVPQQSINRLTAKKGSSRYLMINAMITIQIIYHFVNTPEQFDIIKAKSQDVIHSNDQDVSL